MLFVEDDDDFLHEGEAVDALMHPYEVQLLSLIARSGLAVDPDELATDMRGYTEAEEDAYITRMVDDMFASRMFQLRYFDFVMPKYNFTHDLWMIKADLTERGWEAYHLHRKGVFWDINLGQPAYAASFEYYERLMMEATFRQFEDVCKTITNLPHRIYDPLRESIPAARARVWETALAESYDPTDNMWQTLRWSTLDGLEELKKRRAPMHVVAYERAVRRAATTEHFMLQPTAIRAIPQEPAYDSVRTAAQERMIELWIKRVQGIRDPDDGLFKKVERLGEEFGLVKAEAFLQKMKCWTPLDADGERT